MFPVAGLGTRFLPATKSIPKEMLPIVDKPLIQYAVEEALEAGCDTLIFITSRKKHAISDHFDTAFELETKLKSTESLRDNLRQAEAQWAAAPTAESLGLPEPSSMSAIIPG